MPVAPHIREKLIKNLSDLLKEAQAARQYHKQLGAYFAETDAFLSLKIKFLMVLNQLSAFQNDVVQGIAAQVQELEPMTPSALDQYMGTSEYMDYELLQSSMQAVKYALENDMLVNLREIVGVEVASDYLAQARQMLEEGYSLIAPTIVAGVVLEDSIKTLCERQNPRIDLTYEDKSGKPQAKKVTRLIEDLRKVNCYPESRAKLLKSWADMRNDAAHNLKTDHTKREVELMIDGIEDFVTTYLS